MAQGTIPQYLISKLTRSPNGDKKALEVDHSAAVNERIVLTHGDLASPIILVKDGVIVAIVDLETFGWYFSFWEYNFVYRGASERGTDH